MYYLFDNSFLTGCEIVDHQHSQLFKTINELIEACEQKKENEEIAKSINFLNEYTINHFFDEEQILKKHRFSDFDNHHRYHEKFTEKIRSFSKRHAVEGTSDLLIEDIKKEIGSWLINHIKGEDFRWTAELKETAPKLFIKKSDLPVMEKAVPEKSPSVKVQKENRRKKELKISIALKITCLSTLLMFVAVTVMTILGIYFTKNLMVMIYTAAGILIISLGINIFAFRLWIINPVKKIIAALRRIEDGNISRQMHMVSADEMGEIALHLDKTTEKFKHLVMIIQNQAEEVDDIGMNLAANMDRTAGAMNEINGSVQNIQQQIITQSNSINATNSSIQRITGNIDKLSEGIEIQSVSVSQSSSAIENMLTNIDSVVQISRKNSESVAHLTEASEEGRKSLQAVAFDIQEIARESEGLQEIIAVLENIASMTSLLSMNAAIEAAHAGEAGKGFAVVAGEVRKLAENSAAQSKTIGTVVKKMRDSMVKISQSTGEVMSRFEDIDSRVKIVSDQEEQIRNAMEEQSTGSRRILEAVGKLNEITHNVKDSSLEMLKESEEIINQGKNLKHVTDEITERMNDMAYRSGEVNASVGHVNSISRKNKDNIDILREAISHFDITDKYYAWNNSYLIGVPNIDEQHKQLFATVNNLIEAIEAGIGKDELKNTLNFLIEYTVTHFNDEEEVQRKYGYPNFEHHHKIHEKFKMVATELVFEALKMGNTDTLVNEVKRKIGDWLITHVTGEDARIGKFIRAEGREINFISE